VTNLARSLDAHSRAVPVRLRGVDGLADVSIDLLEHERRAAVGAAGQPLGGVWVLEALLALPEQVSVPVDHVDPAILAQVKKSPQALAYPASDAVCRVGRPAATAGLVSIPTDNWRRGVQQAHRLAPYCARRIVLATEPRRPGLMLLEASYWGIGVMIQDCRVEREVLAPAPFVPTRYTGAAWSFDEILYSQVWRKCALTREGSCGAQR
jgi:hypothetical protein